jgi:hypothetical protein
MKKTLFVITTTTLFLALFVSACQGNQPPAQQPVAQEPVVQQPVVQEPVAQEPAQPVLAPVCQAASTSCAALQVSDTEPTNTYCVKKIPYQNILVPSGTTIESLDPSGELKCADSGAVSDGMMVVTCTGKELWTYELRFTNSACGGSNLAVGTGQCQEGFGFDAAQQCCAPVSADGAGSVTIKVNIGACPLPQEVPKK